MDNHIGTVLEKMLTFLRPRFTLDCNGWTVEGSIMEWNYVVRDSAGQLAIDAAKCSSGND